MKIATLESWIPSIKLIRNYRSEWLPSDVVAGLSITAVALPIGIAYAQLAGFSAAVGIYSCILPAVAYAIFGTSRQLVVNPDAATCAMVAATVAPLAGADMLHYGDLSIVLALLTGLCLIVGGRLGLGVIANFLSRPILTGYLNGIAIAIIMSQIGALLGFKIHADGTFRILREAFQHIHETHLLTLAVGLALFLLLRAFKRWTPKLPAPLIVAAVGVLAVLIWGLDQKGLAVVGTVPSGLPKPRIPHVQWAELGHLMFGTLGIVFVSFCSMMTTNRGFAAKNNYPIDVNQDMFALGMSDVASGLSGGFVVSGADSRTAVADASGGKTQVASVVAALGMLAILYFLTAPLSYLPIAALAAILVSSATSLFDFESPRRYYRVNPPEFWLSVITTLGVMTIGVLPGVLIAIGLTFLKLLRMASRPHDAVLSAVRQPDGEYAMLPDQATDVPGIMTYRFDAPLLFFNADYFRERVEALLAMRQGKTDWLLFDAETVPVVDVTGIDALDQLRVDLKRRGIILAFARVKGIFRNMLERSGLSERIGGEYVFATMREAIQAYRNQPIGQRGETA